MAAGSLLSAAARSMLLLLCSLALVLNPGSTGAVHAVHGGSNREVEAGDVLPQVSARTLEGDVITIPAREGITVVLFWATWSPRSKPALELWGKFSRDYGDKPLTVISVNAERDELSVQDHQAIQGYIAENIQELPVVMDEGLKLFDAYAVKALPTAFFMESSGKLMYRYASFPTSATLDLQEELEITLGLRERRTEEEQASRGRLEYQPRNNALLHYNMAVQLYRKGYRDKALERMVISLQKDPDYEDPLRTLEGIYFPQGRTPEAEAQLRELLVGNGLDAQVDRIGAGEPIIIQGPEKIDAMERMRQLLEKNDPPPDPSR